MINLLLGMLTMSIFSLVPVSETAEPFMVPELEDPIVITVSEEMEQSIITMQEQSQDMETGEIAVIENDHEKGKENNPAEKEEPNAEEKRNDKTFPDEEPTETDVGPDSEPVTYESETEPVPENAQAEESREPEREEAQETEEPQEKEVPETEKQPEEQEPEQEHVHSWVDITETIHHEAEYEMVPVYEEQEILDEEAWDEQVSSGEYIYSCLCCSFETMDLQTMGEHCLDEDHSYTCRQLTETVHHEAVYHVETVQVGEEKVLVKEAWDEEVVTDKRCSICGETTE